MPIAKFQMQDGRIARFEVPDGTTPDQAQSIFNDWAKTSPDVQQKPPEGFGARLSREIGDIPRQLGLTARAGLEGVGALTQPVGMAIESLGLRGAGTNAGRGIADMIGLPTPNTGTERISGKAAELMASTFGGIGAASKLAQGATGTTRNVLQSIAARPDLQAASAAGAGTAGEYVKETGGDPLAQGVAAVAGGLMAPASMGIANRAGQSAQGAIRRIGDALVPRNTPPPVNVDIKIANALQNSGMRVSDIPAGVMNALRADVAQMGDIGNLDSGALRRLVDYRLIGATPSRGSLTLNPIDITREKNLAKIGANSSDATLQSLAERQNENNARLIARLNELGVNSADSIAGAQPVMGRLSAVNDAAKAKIGTLYEAARNTSGRSASLDPSFFTNRADELLSDALLQGKISPDVRSALNKTATGEMPLTVDVAEQLKTRVGELQRASNDAAERMALGKVRQALDETPLLDGQGQVAIDAFNKARRANRNWMSVVERTPALQAIRDGIEPDKFVQQFIIGSGKDASVMSVGQLKNLVRGSPEAMDSIKGQIANFLHSKALGSASDEVGKFSPNAFNKAVLSIGDRKLAMFFSPEEIGQIKALGRVASYENVQPAGSAVNNSNTAGAAIGSGIEYISRLPLLGKIPMGAQLVQQPLINISSGLQARSATDIPNALRGRGLLSPQGQINRPYALPLAVLPGLLAGD